MSLQLFHADEWEFGRKASADLRRLGYTPVAAADLILEALKLGLPINRVSLGEPPGSGGIGYTMNRVDGWDLHVKFKLEWTRVFIPSFHESKHSRGG